MKYKHWWLALVLRMMWIRWCSWKGPHHFLPANLVYFSPSAHGFWMKMFNYVDICEANSPFQALGCFHLILTHPMQALSPDTSVLSKLSFLLYILSLILPTNGTQHLVSQYIVSGWSLWPIRLAHIVSHQVWVGADMWTILRLILEAICKEDIFFLEVKVDRSFIHELLEAIVETWCEHSIGPNTQGRRGKGCKKHCLGSWPWL